MSEESGKFEEKEDSMRTSGKETVLNCPQCKGALQKCLVQQNYAMVICPNAECFYPFNEKANIDSMFYVEDSEMLDVATKRLSKK